MADPKKGTGKKPKGSGRRLYTEQGRRRQGEEEPKRDSSIFLRHCCTELNLAALRSGRPDPADLLGQWRDQSRYKGSLSGTCCVIGRLWTSASYLQETIFALLLQRRFSSPQRNRNQTMQVFGGRMPFPKKLVKQDFDCRCPLSGRSGCLGIQAHP